MLWIPTIGAPVPGQSPVTAFFSLEERCYIQMVADGLPPKSEWVRADFNGLFGEHLCLSHGPTCVSQSGVEITLSSGLQLTAFDEDADESGQWHRRTLASVAPVPWLGMGAAD